MIEEAARIASEVECVAEAEIIDFRARGASNVPQLVGASGVMQELRQLIQRVAQSDRPALVTGPTGAGKEVVVRAIHGLGRRANAPLLDLNCGAFPAALIESQLFGHERGAFTGADKKHDGFFEVAGTGTVFLDELAEMPLELQAKLLRVLETGMFRPIGASASRRFNGRIIAATCADLEERVATGRFREDLYYRLNVLEVRVPSVDERREDVPMLLQHFASMQPRHLVFTNDAYAYAKRMPWRGNAREMRNLVDRLAVLAPEGPITATTLAQFARGNPSGLAQVSLGAFAREVLQAQAGDKLQMAESILIKEALRLSDGNKAAAARLLGVHRKVIERRTGRAS
jgi:DNA-binding NtrC family response regulator